MVFEHQAEYQSQWRAIESISDKLGVNHETLRIWVRRAETDAGQRPGLTTDERQQLRESRLLHLLRGWSNGRATTTWPLPG